MGDTRATVLVVDDTPTKRYILSSWLRRAGHRVVEATGGGEALFLVGEVKPDLVVLDIRMPDISGFEVCERIKGDPATAAIPVIQVSAAAIAASDRTEGLERGADAYLTEPIEPDEFTATVEATLRYYWARRRAERMAARLAQLVEITLRINEAETFDELLRVAAGGAAQMLERPAGLLALAPNGKTRAYIARPGRETTAMSATPGSLDRLTGRSLGEAAGVRLLETGVDEWTRIVPGCGITSGVRGVVCRTKTGRPPVYLGVASRPPMDEGDTNLLRQLGQALALAVDALRAYTEEHTIALTLQRSLLPRRVPDIPGLRISVRYQPAAKEVGGDFYEVLPLGERVLVALGDVQGHSLHAATVMAELRHALRASLLDKVDPAHSMGLLNTVLRRYHPLITATVCLLLIAPATGEVELVNAGHIPPLLAGKDARYHPFGDLMLGVTDETYRVERLILPEDGTILLFTDGLIEDRDRMLDDGLETARRLAEDVGDDLDAFCDRLIGAFGAREDDFALVAVRRTGERKPYPSE